ncbi:MAG TPA: hypothetical protein VH210_07165, partial [Gaiellaceae bacterium]|nr:hypothetical protein [Gaiellaceae bacterium]
VLAAVACLLAAPAARADGDPASDYLLGTSAFLPSDANVPDADAKQLQAVLAEAKARGFEIRVALIASEYDMGSVGTLFLKPSQYARFLGQELFFVYKGRLLVVMPNGYGVSRGGKASPSAQRIAGRLSPPGIDGHALATGATAAVRKIAAADGVHLSLPQIAPAKSHSGNWLLIGIVALVVIAAAAGAIVGRRRRA